MFKIILVILLLIPQLTFSKFSDFKNFYYEHNKTLNELSYCEGYLLGVETLMDWGIEFLQDNQKKENVELSDEEKLEMDSIIQYHSNLKEFLKLTSLELNKKIRVECANNHKQCIERVKENKKSGFDDTNILVEIIAKGEEGLTDENNQLFDDVEKYIEQCYKKVE